MRSGHIYADKASAGSSPRVAPTGKNGSNRNRSKTLDELRTQRRAINRAKIAAVTDDDIRRQAIEDGEDPDTSLGELELVDPVHVVRRKLGMPQAEFAKAFRIPSAPFATGSKTASSRTRPPVLC